MTGFVKRPKTAFSLDQRGGKKRRPRVHSNNHLAWIRTLPSVVRGQGAVEAAHIRFGDPRYAKPKAGMQEKPDDKWVLPLCAEQHRIQHNMNEIEYWQEQKIDPVLLAALLWAHTGHDDAAVQLINNFRGC